MDKEEEEEGGSSVQVWMRILVRSSQREMSVLPTLLSAACTFPPIDYFVSIMLV